MGQVPPEIVAAPLQTDVALGPVAADGFPIDQQLQQQARRAAVGYALIALYYILVLPFVLRYVRWGSLRHIAADLGARAEILVTLGAYILVASILAACAWRVISMRRWTSWATVALSTVFTAWIAGNLAFGLWSAWSSIPASLSLLQVAVSLALLAACLVCCLYLVRAVVRFNRQRSQAIATLEGRIESRLESWYRK